MSLILQLKACTGVIAGRPRYPQFLHNWPLSFSYCSTEAARPLNTKNETHDYPRQLTGNR